LLEAGHRGHVSGPSCLIGAKDPLIRPDDRFVVQRTGGNEDPAARLLFQGSAEPHSLQKHLAK
jgi:hypothetical protein